MKLNFIREKTFKEEIHRAGWNWVTKSLVNEFHDPKADILVDEFIEKHLTGIIHSIMTKPKHYYTINRIGLDLFITLLSYPSLLT